MEHIIIKTLCTTIVIYFIILFLTRILGAKLISNMTLFDYIVGIMVGTAAVEAAIDMKKPAISALVALIEICLLTLIIDLLHLKSIRLRKLVSSEPVVVIENGQINDRNMKKVRLTIVELTMMLRENSYFNLSDIETAILETDGKLSVQAKSSKQPLTPSDVNIPTAYKGLTRDIIIDGNIVKNNLTFIHKDEAWLKHQLKGYGVNEISEVFYAGLDSSGNFYVSKRNKDEEIPGKHGIE